MEILKPRGDLRSFFDRLSVATHRALLLDYDGTLAPFQIERGQAFPYPGIREILDDIIGDDCSRVALVSGRWTEDLIPLLGLKQLPEIWGSHGVERLMPDGTYEIGALDDNYKRGLSEARSWAQEEGLFDRCEEKPTTLALHWRGLNPDVIEDLRGRVQGKWEQIAKTSGLSVHEFDGGLELRGHANKAIAVEAILSEMGENPIMAYLGDDQTDEDAFHALDNRGLCVLVRTEYRPTAAHVWLKPPGELLEFLNRWKEVCRY